MKFYQQNIIQNKISEHPVIYIIIQHQDNKTGGVESKALEIIHVIPGGLHNRSESLGLWCFNIMNSHEMCFNSKLAVFTPIVLKRKIKFFWLIDVFK